MCVWFGGGEGWSRFSFSTCKNGGGDGGAARRLLLVKKEDILSLGVHFTADKSSRKGWMEFYECIK